MFGHVLGIENQKVQPGLKLRARPSQGNSEVGARVAEREILANVAPSRVPRRGAEATRPHGEREIHFRFSWLFIEGQQQAKTYTDYK